MLGGLLVSFPDDRSEAGGGAVEPPELVLAEANLSRALVGWSSNRPGLQAVLERRTDPLPYKKVTDLIADSEGMLVAADSGVVHGVTYHYRLTVSDTTAGPEAAITVPRAREVVIVVGASAEPDRVRIAWDAGENPRLAVTVERRFGDEGWSPRAAVRADEDGIVTYLDAAVAPVTRYVYRLAIGEESVGEVAVTTPHGFAFALEGAVPNPAPGVLLISYQAANREPVTLELFGPRGDRVLSRRIEAPSPGPHVVDLTAGSALASGTYLLRVRQGSRVAVRRVTVLR